MGIFISTIPLKEATDKYSRQYSVRGGGKAGVGGREEGTAFISGVSSMCQALG